MVTINDIRKYMDLWCKQTYRDGLEYCYSIKNDKKIYDLTVEVLKIQKLNDKVMDGNSVRNIPKIDEGKTEIIFSDVFWELVKDYLTPVYYVANIVKKCVNSTSPDVESVAKIVGRGLRSFPSFLREMDLTNKISSMFPNAHVSNGPEQDVQDHTDVLIQSDNRVYRLWSYQVFDRGLDNTASRFYGRRGELPSGYHVLCPIDIQNKEEIEEIDGWYLYSDRYVKYIYEMIAIEKPDLYDGVIRLEEYALRLYLKKANIVYK